MILPPSERYGEICYSGRAILLSSVTVLTTLAGLPTTTAPAGTSEVTTLPAPMTAPEPMVTPGRMVQFPPIQTSSPMWTSAPLATPVRRASGSSGWLMAKMQV